MGITDDQIESMADEMAGLMNPDDMEGHRRRGRR